MVTGSDSVATILGELIYCMNVIVTVNLSWGELGDWSTCSVMWGEQRLYFRGQLEGECEDGDCPKVARDGQECWLQPQQGTFVLPYTLLLLMTLFLT